MANDHTLNVQFQAYEDGDLALAEAEAAVFAITGVPATKREIIRDTNGKLVNVKLLMEKNEAAKSAINNNPGVAITSAFIPPALTAVIGLDATVGIASTVVQEAAGAHQLSAYRTNPGDTSITAGDFLGIYFGDAYTNYTPTPNSNIYVALLIEMQGATDYVIPAGSGAITIKLDNGLVVPLSLTNELTLVANPTTGYVGLRCWIDLSGKLYLGTVGIAGGASVISTLGTFTSSVNFGGYELAVANGPL